ncbi:MAG: NAD-glutamate dehydrogenase, partial [Mariprofundaceae bacterium]|nr:NAD-glutamate dehydrogenase [Mariprofundaceae bacterium]
RAGPIARGGLRYSDRPADFRTEVLELMATQTVKNGQIVPTGAKGGFVLRNCAAPDEAFVQSQYRSFVRSLLSLTDNRVGEEIVPPAGIHIAPEDEHDPYFVVAADKGTASYSDLANAEAEAASFWLGDAFASGGRYGYDHKVFGITARGAWVCAAQHLAVMGMDAYRDPIRVVGIGDMGGDVFGNGMLLNPQILLIAAFNHRHIFLDPNPDAAAAFAERRRLFDGRLGWDGYNKDLISAGGGVFERSAKRISLSEAVQQALGVPQASLSGEALIRSILCAPVDMLYNGGIGTYVRSSKEGDAEVRDPANNAVRVAADELRAQMLCEGGNLGMTQAARIEYAAGGGRINTDAIDNSAGVDMSDHEVNLKILFSPALSGLSLAQRNRQLRALSKAVTDQCLDNNRMQSRALSLAVIEAELYPPRVHRLRDMLLADGRISEQTDPGIGDNASLALRPQLAVLLGHEKNRLHERLADCCFSPESPFARSLLRDYFPPAIQRRYADAISAHPLAADIMHTMAANHVVNHCGLGAVHHLETLLDLPAGQMVLGLLAAEYLLDAAELRHDIWRQGEDEQACRNQHRLQEVLMRFAEDLLRLCPVIEMSEDWLKTQRAALRRYASSLPAGKQDDDGKDVSRQAALQQRLDLLAELSQCAAALHLSSSLHLPLLRCLKAGKACLALLPFHQLESALRTPAWGDDASHALRREWLSRLSQLRCTAITRLLQSGHRDPRKAGYELWQEHRHWPELYAMLEWGNADEIRQMDLLLMLTRCESLLAETAASDDGGQV